MRGWSRVELNFAGNLRVRFSGRVWALEQVVKVAEAGTPYPLVVYGPEGCGKSSWLMQAKAILEAYDYKVLYVNPLARGFNEALYYSEELGDVVRDVVLQLGLAIGASISIPARVLADIVFHVVSLILRRFSRPKLALLVDDVFQAIGLDSVSSYVKTALNLIEHPRGEFESIVFIMTTSEGLSRDEIGRHRWADLRLMWNMGREDFRELYDQIPGGKPLFDDTWRVTGGNPDVLRRLYVNKWNLSVVLMDVIERRGLREFIATLDNMEKRGLLGALDNPDLLLERKYISLLRRLIEMNMVIRLFDRNPSFWIDTPPPLEDPELGIGRYVAWQTPLYREALRRILSP